MRSINASVGLKPLKVSLAVLLDDSMRSPLFAAFVLKGF